jgi:hypothetical protein
MMALGAGRKGSSLLLPGRALMGNIRPALPALGSGTPAFLLALAHGQKTRRNPGKRPPAPSVSGRQTKDLTAQIVREIYTVLERLGADLELLAVVGSWRDTLDDAEVLSMLREYNETGRVLHPPQ